jgi:tyrosyl-tRNA synthetase
MKKDMNEKERILEEIFSRGTIVEVLPSEEKFKERLLSGDVLTFYIGFDATAPMLHLSHAKNIMLLEKFRKLGHKAVLLFGDFTAMIGDPSGEASKRKQLSREEVLKNVSEWKKQIQPLMDFEAQENPPVVKYNSEWLDALSFQEVIELASQFTVQQMLERDMFEKRIQAGNPVHLHEFLYPLMQGYDSVMIDADVELCGTDQTFNALAGRTLLKKKMGKEKFVVTVTMMEDPETGELMSKSKGTGIFLNASPRDLFGQVMAQRDSMIEVLFHHTTHISLEEIQEILKDENPRNAKIRLAFEIVRIFYGESIAQQEQKYFIETFSQKIVNRNDLSFLDVCVGESLLDILVRFHLSKSKNEARQKIRQGGVALANEKITDEQYSVTQEDDQKILRVGKKYFFVLKISI